MVIGVSEYFSGFKSVIIILNSTLSISYNTTAQQAPPADAIKRPRKIKDLLDQKAVEPDKDEFKSLGQIDQQQHFRITQEFARKYGKKNR